MTDFSPNGVVLVAGTGTEEILTNTGVRLSRSSTSEEEEGSRTVVVDVETHRTVTTSTSSDPEIADAQINITINPTASSEEEHGSNGRAELASSNISENTTNPSPPRNSAEVAESVPTQITDNTGSTAAAAPVPPVAEMNTNSGRTTASAGGNSSSSRSQRNGLFGINIDLNFDPSWLVASNVAGRGLSVLPDWVRHPVNMIPNRGSDNLSTERGNRDSRGSGSAASRLLSHYRQTPATSGSSFPSSSGGLASSSNMRPTERVSHLGSVRSVDEDTDADYNPVSTIDLQMAGRSHSGSYVIDMDSPMGGWVEEGEVPSTSQTRVSGGVSLDEVGGSNSGVNNTGDSSSDPNRHADNSSSASPGAGNARRSISDIGLGEASGDGNGNGGMDVNAGTDRNRTAEILRDAPETRAVINEISRYTTIRPFIVICFLKAIFDHGSSILAFLALIVTFSHANSMVKKEVSKQKKRNLLYLSMIVINLAACVAFIYYLFNDMGLHYALAFLPVTDPINTFWSLIWVVGVSDYVAKFATVFIKILFLALPGCVVPFQKRGKYYLFIEHTSQIYRSFVPVHPWLSYLTFSYEGTAAMFGYFLAGLYVVFKFSDSIGRFREWFKALEKLLSNVHYGTNPTSKQLDNAGALCPICHDSFTGPTRLACGHIFCEECVATWFDRERTCPMCRAKVVDDPTYRDGSTAQYVQLF